MTLKTVIGVTRNSVISSGTTSHKPHYLIKNVKTLNTNHSQRLKRAAENLRLTDKEQDISKGSELAEIVLYAIMKHKYKALWKPDGAPY